MSTDLFNLNKQAYEKFLSSHNSLYEVCAPLFTYTKFKNFIHGRFLLDEKLRCTKVVIFFTNIALAEWVMHEVMGNGNELNEAARNTPEGEYSYFCYSPTDNLLSLYKEKFNLCNGIIIYKRSKGYIDFWEFSMHTSDACTYSVTNSFIHELQIWIKYFDRFFGHHQILQGPIKHFSINHDYSYRPQQIFQSPSFSLERGFNKDNIQLKLSKTEWKCFKWVGKGRTMKEIALEMGITSRTVETHLNNIKKKTGLNFKTDLTKLYQRKFDLEIF